MSDNPSSENRQRPTTHQIEPQKSTTKLLADHAGVPCVIYTRVSSDEQAKEEHYSLSAQEEYSMAEIKRRANEGWFYVTTISDPGYSGNTFDRPGLLELIALVKAQKVGAVVVYKRERLFRNADLAANVQAVFDLHSVKVLSCVEGLHDAAPHSVLMRQIIDANAQFERANGRKRQYDCLRFAASQGDWKGGTPPFGYSYRRSTRVLEINDDEAKLIRLLFEQLSLGRTLDQISFEWREAGIRGRGRGPNAEPGRRPFIRPEDMKRMVRLPIYRGVVRIRRLRVDVTAKNDKNPDWEEFRGKHQPLVSEDLWWQANRAVDAYDQRTKRLYRPRATKLISPLQGLIRCECCDSSMTPGRSQPKKGYTSSHRYYRCIRQIKGGMESGCTTGQVSAYALETAVSTVFQLFETNPAMFSRFGSETLDQRKKEALAQLEADALHVDHEISRLRKEMENVIAYIKKGEGVLAPEAIAAAKLSKEKLARGEAERIRIQSAMNQLSAKIAPTPEIAKQLGVVSRAVALASLEATIPIYRAIIRQIQVRRATIAEPPRSRKRVHAQRVFRLQLSINTSQLIRFGKTFKDSPVELFMPTGFADTVLSVTIQIRSNRQEQKVILLEQGVTAVSAKYTEGARTQGLEIPSPLGSDLFINPIQRALGWNAQISNLGKTLTLVAEENRVSKGLVSQHIALLRLPQMIVEFLKEGRDRNISRKFSLRELQRLLEMDPGDAVAVFNQRVKGQPVQDALNLT